MRFPPKSQRRLQSNLLCDLGGRQLKPKRGWRREAPVIEGVLQGEAIELKPKRGWRREAPPLSFGF